MIPTGHAVTVARSIRATPDALFRAWIDPLELARWWSQSDPGWRFADAEVDARVGGRYRLGMFGPDGRKHVAAGEYREIDPPRKLVFTWDWEDPVRSVGETLVTVDFRPELGATEVVVTHEQFAHAERIGRHRQGWTDLLELLANAFSTTTNSES